LSLLSDPSVGCFLEAQLVAADWGGIARALVPYRGIRRAPPMAPAAGPDYAHRYGKPSVKVLRAKSFSGWPGAAVTA
jgi:hypothetical protein